MAFPQTARPRIPLAGIFCMLAMCVPQGGWGMASPAMAATHIVVMEGVAFRPEALTVKQGDTVVWINKDFFPHTATAQDRSFDSREIAANGKWKYTADKRGTHPYVCTLHPTMKGTLIVK